MTPTLTDTSTSRFVSVQDGDASFAIHCDGCRAGERVVVMRHGSWPGASGRVAEPPIA